MKSYLHKNISKPRLWAFSFVDKALISGVAILIALLILYPLLNYNNQAVAYLIQKKHEKAEKKWRKALSQDPFSALYRLNLALNYQISHQKDKALKEYEVTRHVAPMSREDNVDADPVSTRDGMPSRQENLFYSFFNSAIIKAHTQQIPKALNLYQSALKWKPDSLAVKTNIELLTQNMAHKNQNSKDQNPDQEKTHKPDPKSHQEDQNKDKKEDSPDNTTGDQEDKKEKDDDKASKDTEKEDTEKEDTENKGDQEGLAEHHTEEPNKKLFQEQKPENTQNQDQKLSPAQISAILKAISDQEIQIKKRRQKQNKRPSPKEKDW